MRIPAGAYYYDIESEMVSACSEFEVSHLLSVVYPWSRRTTVDGGVRRRFLYDGCTF